MNIEHLQEFVYLADSLNFRKTADHFYVSRSVISRHMAALEEALGTRLLQRDARGVQLTEAGEVFHRDAVALLRDWDAARDRVKNLQGEGDKLVRIGYLRNGARPFLVRFVNRMAREHPEIHLSLSCMEYNELQRALDEHAVDIALGINVDPSISRNYRSTQVYRDCFFALCSRSHPLAVRGGAVAFSDLQEQKLLIPESYVLTGLGPLVQKLVDDQTLAATQTYYRDLDLLYLKIQTEGYIAFVSSLNAAMFEDYLAVLPFEDIQTDFVISAFYHDAFHGNAYELCREGFLWCRDAVKENRSAPPFKLIAPV